MRLITGISIATLAVSVTALALVLWLVVTEPWDDSVGQMQGDVPEVTVEPVPIDRAPLLTPKLIFGLLEQYASFDSRKPGWKCLSDNKLNIGWFEERWPELVISFNPHHGYVTGNAKWAIKATGRHCDGVEVFLIDDITAEVTYESGGK